MAKSTAWCVSVLMFKAVSFVHVFIVCLKGFFFLSPFKVGVKGNPQGFNRGLDCDVIVAEVITGILISNTASCWFYTLNINKFACILYIVF